MSTIRGYSQSNYYDSADNDYSAYNQNASSFLAGLSINSGSNNNNGIMGGINLSDYASIKNGSYRKLVKAYYAKQKADNASSGKDSSAKLTSMGSMSGTLAKSADALMKDSLWEKKEIKTKDEKTGEETTKEDYDWDSITKAVKSLVDNYNKTIESAGNSNTKDVLRNAAWLTKTTKSTERLLEKVGITIGADNKLELDEDALKKADMSTLKSVFTGYNSFASKVYDKAQSISNAAARAGGTYISTTDKDGNKVMDKMSKGETMKAVNDISKQYGDNVIVEFPGDGMAALADHKQLHDLPESHKEIPDWMLTQNEGPQNLTKEELAEMQGSKEGTDMEAIMRQMDPNAYKEYQSAKADGMEKGGAEGITAGFRYMYNWVTSNAKNDSHWMDSYDPDKKQEADFEIELTDKLKGCQHS